MRLFVGLDLPPDVVANLESLIEDLRPTALIHWSPPANLHITTKFIGELPDERLPSLTSALQGVPARPPIPVRIEQLGFFPNARAPRVFWCGVSALGLDTLARDTDRAASVLGIPGETRVFSAHLTLARIKEPLDLQPLHDRIAALPSLEFGAFTAYRFFLYRSKPGPKGSVYTKLAEFPLTK